MRTHIQEITGKNKEGFETLLLAAQNVRGSRSEQLAVLADFSELPDSYRYLGALIASTLQRAWSDGKENDDPQKRLVAGLRAVNNTLANESRSGSAQWVGSLRAVILAQIDSQISLSSSGGFTALLARMGNTTEIPLEPGEGTRPFGSLTTGPLQVGDELAIGPRELFNVPGTKESLSTEPDRFFAKIKKSDQKGCLRLSVSAHTPTKLRHATLPQLERIKGLKQFTHILHPNISFRSPKLSFPRLSVHFSFSKLFKNMLRPKMLQRKPRWSLAARAFVLLVIGSALLAGTFVFRGKDASPQNTEALTEARLALDAGETELILGNISGALAAWETGIAAIATLTTEDAGALRAELFSRRNTLSGIESRQVEELASFAGFPLTMKPERFALAPTDMDKTALALLDPHATALWANQKLSGSGGTFIFLPGPLSEPLTDIVALKDEKHFVTATRDGYALIDHKERISKTVSLSKHPLQTKFLAGNTDRVYGILTESGIVELLQIQDENDIAVRVWGRNTAGEFTEIQDAAMAGDALAILMPDNTFLKYRNGKRIGRYRIEGYGWEGTVRAFTAFPDNQLAALDTKNGRVLIINADGDIKRQLESESLKEALDIAPSPDGTKLYILTPSSLLKLAITE